jgi:transposase-like protein
MAAIKNLKDLMVKFQDEQTCRDYLVQHRWGGTPICPYCGSNRSYKIENGKRFKCANKECHKKYSVTVGTVAQDTNISLCTWFAAIYLISAHKKGISSVQLGKDLGIAQKTAWFMLHRIRESMRVKSFPFLTSGEVEADETYMGGKEANKHVDKRSKDSDGNYVDCKAPVMGVIVPGGEVRTKVVNEVTKVNATEFILSNVKQGVTLVTDAHPSYHKVGKKFDHVIVNHKEKVYKFEGHTTNHIENYWSILKRGVYGIYHQVSVKHLQAYCDEFAYRFNTRKIADNERFELTLCRLEGSLPYKTLTAKPSQYGAGKEIEETPEE